MGTKIQWCDEVINPIVGCSRVSPGCANCYAAAVAQSARLQQFPQYQKVGAWDGTVEFVESQLTKPLKWRSPKKIFVCSMSDLFHENIPDEWRDRVFAVMAMTPHHTYQVLTKRPENALRYLSQDNLKPKWRGQVYGDLYDALPKDLKTGYFKMNSHWDEMVLPARNVWVGTTVENQATADERIPLLLQVPAAVRWLSVEPLLGEIDLLKLVSKDDDGLRALEYINWVVVGGESGPRARPLPIEWVEAIAQQCQTAGVPVFLKQLGSFCVTSTPEKFPKTELVVGGVYSYWCFWEADRMGFKLEGMSRVKLHHRAGGNIEEFPAHLQIREFPQ